MHTHIHTHKYIVTSTYLISNHKLTINKLTINKLTINKLTINKLTINRLTINKLTTILGTQVGWTPRDEPLSDVYSPTRNVLEEEETLDYTDHRSKSTSAPTLIGSADAYAYTSVGAAPNFGSNMYQDTRENGWWGAGNGAANAYAKDGQSA
jgi:hypothetical protein